MSFFREFKEDARQALNELMPGDDMTKDDMEDDSDIVVNTLENELNVEAELSKLDGLLEKVTKDVKEPKAPENKIRTINAEPAIKIEAENAAPSSDGDLTEQHRAQREADQTLENHIEVEEDKKMSDFINEAEVNETEAAAAAPAQDPAPASREISDEVSVITESTSLKGNLESTGSLDIRGTINGDVSCNGKLVVTGTIVGNSTSSEFFADAAKIEGEVSSSGTVKVGLGSVIIGNITATSAVIAGAIKGDIDVQGPVVVDTSAVIMGNIKSRSVQINNGAVIEGFCSQCYADIDVESLFGQKKVD